MATKKFLKFLEKGLDKSLNPCYNKYRKKRKRYSKMTDKELVYNLLSRLTSQPVTSEREDYVEIQNACYGEDIVFEFDKDGNLTSIYS